MTNTNDSETKGPERIHADIKTLGDEPCGAFFISADESSGLVEYIRAYLYTQSQRELEELRGILKHYEKSTPYPELVRAAAKLDQIEKGWIGTESYWHEQTRRAEEERDRYRDCLSTLYARERPDSAVAQIIRESIIPSDAQASESDDAVTREGG